MTIILISVVIVITLLTIGTIILSSKANKTNRIETLPEILRRKKYEGFDKEGNKRLIIFPNKHYPVLRLYKNLSKTSTSLWTFDDWKITGGPFVKIEFTILDPPTIKSNGKEWMPVEIEGELIDFFKKED